MPNRLAFETSPYLLQHADNPVEWYAWGPEALERARVLDRPILLSIGYAACHWCHVMAHESFEDAGTAAVMNRLFVNVKVDREERPDIDSVYMQAVQAMTGHGGWPMTMFLTPAGEPYYGGTYFPPEDRHGMPSFRRILEGAAAAYRDRKDHVEQTIAALHDQVYAAAEAPAAAAGTLSATTLERAYRALAGQFDARHGGFGGAPKFPPTMTLDFLLRYHARTGTAWALEMARATFRAMARGGIYDHVGGGFARYATDAAWLVPHFEKMLYDNALLVRLGAGLWQATGDPEARRVTMETCEWLRREMTSPAGGFYSSLDADSEGHEGKFYLWDEPELDDVLGDDAGLVRQYWAVTRGGNFEGRNILEVPDDAEVVARRAGVTAADVEAAVARAKPLLYARRASRVWPGRDEKILAGWNGLMLRGLAEAARAFGDAGLRELAVANGEFLRREMVRDGRVMRSHKDGATRIPGFLEDHAAVALGFLALYELTFDPRWLADARQVADATVRWFWSDDAGAFHDTASDAEALITRPRDVTDNAVPSGTSLAADLLLRLAVLDGVDAGRRRAAWIAETLAEPMARHPTAFGNMLGVADMLVHGAVELAIVGDAGSEDVTALVSAAAGAYVPSLVVAGGDADGDADRDGAPALLRERPMRGGRATAYVCRGHACDAPTVSPDELREQLAAAGRV